MLGLNEIKSTENLSSNKIFALCESMVERMDDPELKRFRANDSDRYLRTLKTQFKALDDRYPSIFNVLLEYGRRTPDGFDTLARIKQMLNLHDKVQSGETTKDNAEKALDYEYSYQYVRPVIGAEKFDEIVKPPSAE